MRKSTAALAALALSALALTGCSSAPSFDGASCERDSSAGLAKSVEVSGDLGEPKAQLSTPVRTEDTAYADVIVGEGRAITSSEQNAIVSYALFNGASGDALDAGTTLWNPASVAEQLPGVDDALKCATAGSRVVVSIPAKELAEGMAEQVGLGEKDSVIGVLDIRYAALPKAEGRDVFNDASGLPTVVRASDGRPGIIVPDGDAPSKPVVQTLIEGDGEKVGEGSPMFHYTAVNWSDRTVAASSWESGMVLDASALPKEVGERIAKSTVGSQFLAVVPGDGGDATAYVVDVLGVVPEELTRQ
ncbi:hypothetical protein [Microbacterium sp.]|uniref:hypothetical protein n=1 Tax=Microbacterium sp. TaxID=51671 RepID=UPI0028113B4A|nr:hypothetical protein [Microbacterium sp.]